MNLKKGDRKMKTEKEIRNKIADIGVTTSRNIKQNAWKDALRWVLE